ncbi:hypothetical protein L1787_03055 [Acuticoccus sp. M5D2P5]|uniref:hypothetical protein n=1 Tax=Acuticoccus kalidii TaxID=2910977 RepID=UPI001F1F86E9|nr:hypothetical protein [Acuticoccus kalidii]MCF3932393.1 hypothetical protein [Acuticoccus kalidii]
MHHDFADPIVIRLARRVSIALIAPLFLIPLAVLADGSASPEPPAPSVERPAPSCAAGLARLAIAREAEAEAEAKADVRTAPCVYPTETPYQTGPLRRRAMTRTE